MGLNLCLNEFEFQLNKQEILIFQEIQKIEDEKIKI